MQLVGYEDCYYQGVTECLKRNYGGLNRMSEADFEEWFNPIINYAWLDRVQDVHPWTRGVVLLEDDAVVGYFGLLFSFQKTSNNPQQLFINFTTWAIDEAYRFQVFGVISEIEKIPNAVFTDYSACEAINSILTQLCHFERIETHETVFLPFPCLCTSLKCTKCTLETLEGENRKIFADHAEYAVKAVKVTNGVEECVVFYKVMKRKIKNAIPFNRISILYVDNVELFAKFARAIIFKLQRMECGYLIVDKRFLGSKEYSAFCKTRKIDRFAKSTDTNACTFESNYLYSEIGILSDC